MPRSTRLGEALSGHTPFENDDNHDIIYSLKGVRFKALSAPGPSGARPEHLREMMACSNKQLGRRLLQSISKFVDAASRGLLPDESRFILDSRLVYLKKKN